jgi:hypothetical protein
LTTVTTRVAVGQDTTGAAATLNADNAKEAVMEERDDWVQADPGSLAPDVFYSTTPAEVYLERPRAVDEEATKGTLAVDCIYPSIEPAPRPAGEWESTPEWVPDTRPSAAPEHPLDGRVIPAPAAVERESGEQSGLPVTLAPEALVVSAVIVEAPRSGDRDGPWQRRVPGTVAAEFPHS